jgi:streptomycin 6-kinase
VRHIDKTLQSYCGKWELSNPVLLARTFTSHVYKVRFCNEDAVLKILNEKGQKFESKGANVLRCLNGNGSVRILNSDDGAHLLEFIDGPQLRTLVEAGADDEATEIICDVVSKIHSYAGPQPEDLISMERNFRALFEIAKKEKEDSIYKRGADLARELIDSARDIRVLHGDIHHENILQHSVRGWVAIDPQCLFGERAYDLANAFYNPNGFADLAATPERIERLCRTFSRRLRIEPQRLLQYAFAYGCLSSAWCLEDSQSPDDTLKIVHKIEACLSGSSHSVF